MQPSDQRQPDSITSPLGGRVRRPVGTAPGRRPGAPSWTGYRRKVRACPACGRENAEHHLFCDDCAADLRAVPVTAAGDGSSGRRRFVDLLAGDRGRALARRRQVESAGGGFLALGAILFIAAIWMTTDETVRTIVWSASLASLVLALWRMRYDQDALRRTGLMLSGASGAVLLLIASQSALFPREPNAAVVGSPVANTSAEAVATPGTPAVATPGAVTLRGEVRMYRGGPALAGQQPGPPPRAQPSVLWRFETGGEIYSSPAVAGGAVYFTSKAGFLYAVDAGTGEQRWRYELGDYVVRSSPAVVDGVVYVGAGFSLAAVDATTGQERWRFPMRYAGHSSPIVVDGVVYITSQEGFVYAVDAASGTERWNLQTEGLVFSAPALADDTLLLGTDAGVLYGVRAGDGRLDWRRNLDGPIFAPVAAGRDGVAYVTIGAGFTYAIKIADGEQVWQAAVGGDEAPAIAGDLLVLSAKDGGVYGLNIANGTSRWLFPTGEDVTAAPAAAGDLLVVSAGRSVFLLDRASGTRRWYFLAGDTVESAPTVVDGVILFGNRDGFLYAVGAV